MNTVFDSLNRWLRHLGPKPQIERRRSPRSPFKKSIEVRASSGTTYRGFGRDLSESGLGAIVYADLKVGDSVILYYTHPQHAASKFVCRPAYVRRRHGSRYGFEFAHALPS